MHQHIHNDHKDIVLQKQKKTKIKKNAITNNFFDEAYNTHHNTHSNQTSLNKPRYPKKSKYLLSPQTLPETTTIQSLPPPLQSLDNNSYFLCFFVFVFVFVFTKKKYNTNIQKKI